MWGVTRLITLFMTKDKTQIKAEIIVNKKKKHLQYSQQSFTEFCQHFVIIL
jgi:hypothetical protein